LSADASASASPTDSMGAMASRAPRFAAVFFWAIFVCEHSARAEPPESTEAAEARPYVVTIRGAAGLGIGQIGLTGRAALSGEGWFSDHFGVGAFWGGSVQLGGVFGPSEALQFVGATVAARTAGCDSYGMLVVGAGYAWGQDQGGGLFDAPPPTSVAGILGTVSGAWLFHDGPFETGPIVVLDATSFRSAMVTANWAVGFAL
jgi:hypothetical protein